jgi:tripeptide aminopeptidase
MNTATIASPTSTPRSAATIRQQLADLARVKASSQAYGTKDFASRMAFQSICADEKMLQDELRVAESMESANGKPLSGVSTECALLDRFCRYVRIDTQADEASTTYPSTPGQLELGGLLAQELQAMGVRDAVQDEHGIVLATLPSTQTKTCPVIAWISHVDTSPETSGHGVKPIVHRNYDGKDIVLPGDPSKVLRVADNPALLTVVGKTLVTTDGTTLLGADDKAGIAVIMQAAAHLMAHPEIAHGPIRICFTCDEEIGHGVDHLDLKTLGAHVGYTLDGGGVGEIDDETFSADLAVVTINGVNIHPAIAKDRMINAMRIAGAFLDHMPRNTLAPETTSDREGFLHPYRIEGGVASVTMRILLRDFETAKLADKAKLLRSIAELLQAEHPHAKIDVKVTPQYRNMADGLVKEPRAVEFAAQAMQRAGLQPRRTIVRGGTDGSRLTELGLPTPNLSCGEHNLHSPLEWTCVEEMETAARVLVELAQIWGDAS